MKRGRPNTLRESDDIRDAGAANAYNPLATRRDDSAPCANPFCDTRVAYRGEFCRDCRAQQDAQRRRMRTR